MRALDGLDVKVESAGSGVGADGGIARVGEGAGLLAAETRDVVLVATEGLIFGGFELKRTEVGSNDGPNKIVWFELARVAETVETADYRHTGSHDVVRGAGVVGEFCGRGRFIFSDGKNILALVGPRAGATSAEKERTTAVPDTIMR
jgi:hypothetical protein